MQYVAVSLFTFIDLIAFYDDVVCLEQRVIRVYLVLVVPTCFYSSFFFCVCVC